MKITNFAVFNITNGRKNILLAGVTNDVCILFGLLSLCKRKALMVIIDGGGSPSQIADAVAQKTSENKGVRTTTINQIFSELVPDWSTEDGQKALPILFEEIMSKVEKYPG